MVCLRSTLLTALCLALLLEARLVRAGEEPRMRPQDVDASSWLVRAGEPACVIIAPDGAASAMAQAVANALKVGDAAPDILRPEDALAADGPRIRDEVQAQTLILLGDINSNRALLPLYARYTTFADAAYPGMDGYELKTSYRPWRTEANAIVLGASDSEGLARAAAGLVEMAQNARQGDDLRLPYVCEVHSDVPSLPTAPGEMPTSGSGRDAAHDGYAYAATGKDYFARRCYLDLQALCKPQTRSLPLGDYTLDAPARAWTMAYLSPALSPEERAEIDQRFLEFLSDHQDDYWRCKRGGSIGGRHQTMGTWAFYTVVKHLLFRGNPNAVARELLERWDRECRSYLDYLGRSWHDDLEGIPVYHSIQSAIQYALEEGIGEFFDEDYLRKVVERALAVTDNMTYYCGTGTYEEARPGTVKASISLGFPASVAACYYRDEGMNWLWKEFVQERAGHWTPLSFFGLHRFATGDTLATRVPDELLGVQVVPFMRKYYDRMPQARAQAQESGGWLLSVPHERTYEKLSLRESFDRRGQYLVLEGKQYCGADNLVPKDANAILRFADLGEIWLYTNSFLSSNFHRNAVYVSDGINKGPQPAACELIGTVESPDAAIVLSRLPDYVGSEWSRALFWLKGQAVGVVDRVEFKRAGEYSVQCTWRSPAFPRLDDDVWKAPVGDKEFTLLNADDRVRQTSREEGLEGAAIPTFLRQYRRCRARVGEETGFRNLFYASDPSTPRSFAVRPLGGRAMLVRNERSGAISLLAARGAQASTQLGPFDLTASAALVSPDEVLLLGEGALRLDGRELTRAQGASEAGPAVARALQELWHRPEPVGLVQVLGQDLLPPNPTAERWRFSGLTRPGEPMRGVGLTTDPPADKSEDLVDALLPLWFGNVGWPRESRPRLTFTLPQEEEIAEIEVRTGMVTRTNVRPDPDNLPTFPAAQAEFSTDNFQADVRTQELQWQSSYNAEQLHKAEFYPLGKFTVEGLKHKARQVRLTFSHGFSAKEITLRRSRRGDTRIQKIVVTDLQGEGTLDVLVTSSQNELVALTLEGKELWRQRFNGPINCVHVAALSDGLDKTVLVGTLESWVYAFAPDGRELWRAETLFLGGDCPGPYSIATWRPQAGGALEIVVGNYDRCSFFSAQGERIGWSMAAGAFETMTLAPGLDLNGDGCEDALMFNNWRAISFIDGAQRKMTGSYRAPGGWGICLDCIDPSPEDPLALVVADNGARVFHMKDGQAVFALDTFPISSCAWGDLTGNGQTEIVLGKHDGFVLVLGREGELLGRVAVGEPVLDLVLLPGEPGRLLLACETTLRELGADLGERWTATNPGVVKLRAPPGQPPRLLAATADADLVMWQLDGQAAKRTAGVMRGRAEHDREG